MVPSKIGAKAILPATWKEALYESFHRSTAPLKAIADALGLSRSHLDKCCDEAQTENLNSRHLPALAAATSDLTWLDFLEARAGRQAYVLPAAGALISMQTVASLREFAEFCTVVAEAAADGRVCVEDRVRIEREGLDAIASIHAVIAAAKAQAPTGEPAGPHDVTLRATLEHRPRAVARDGGQS